MSAIETSCFLGSNAPGGFYSLYGDFTKELSDGVLYIIKGGPGCGKSTFMKRVAKGLCDRGYSVERIWCSGDPESLDAVYFPDLKLAYVDGTAPHALEPKYPGAAGRYLNLGIYCDAAALQKLRGEITAATDRCSALYGRAYDLIEASAAAVRNMYSPLYSPAILSRVRSRARGIIAREAKAFEPGPVKKRFLGALTCRGRIDLFQTVKTLAGRVCVIDGEYGLAPVFMEEVASELKRRGCGFILCPDEMRPENIRHIIVPCLSLAFATSTRSRPWEGEAFRHIRLDALIADVPQEKKQVFRTCSRLSESLEREAVKALAEAKSAHDCLEGLYNSHVDFAGVCALADAHISTVY